MPEESQQEPGARIRLQPIEQEMQRSYIDYAMSVIVGRALPDVRDGLKPVQRRILYTMREEGMTSGAQFKKSARVVGGCLARYHPHGDMAIYDALARMVQDFSLLSPRAGSGELGKHGRRARCDAVHRMPIVEDRGRALTRYREG